MGDNSVKFDKLFQMIIIFLGKCLCENSKAQ